MKKMILFILIGLGFSSCANNNSVDRPYIISQSQSQESPEDQELD